MSPSSATWPATADADAVERVGPSRPARLEVRYRRLEPGHPLLDEPLRHERRSIVLHRKRVLVRHRGNRRFVADPTVLVLLRPGDHYRLEPIGPFVEELRFDLPDEGPPASDPTPALTERSARATPYLPLRAPSFLQVLLHNRMRRILDVPHSLATTVLRASETAAHDALFLDGGPPRRHPLSDDHFPLVERARRRLAETYRELLPAEDLAAELGCSLSHLCRRFRAETGVTLRAYRTQLRVREAAARLIDGSYTHDSLGHLAEAMGYCTHSHFSAAFHRAFGMTPFQLRRLARATK